MRPRSSATTSRRFRTFRLRSARRPARPRACPRSRSTSPRATIAANHARLAEALPSSIPYTPPPASYLAWLDCRATGLGDDPAAAFLQRGRIALSRGLDFGAAGAGFARLNVGTTPDLLEEAVRRLEAALTP